MPSSNASLSREIATIRKSFVALASSFRRIAPMLVDSVAGKVTAPQNGGTARTRRAPRLTAAHRAALKLQGRYMGTMRALKPGQRAKVKKIRAAKGVRAAIKAAERMAG